METLHLQERQRIRLFARRDAFARFVSCLVYVPRERYNTELRRRFQDILEEALGGRETEYQVQVSESTLARIHFIVRMPDGLKNDIDLGAIEGQLVKCCPFLVGTACARRLIDAHGEEDGNRFFGGVRFQAFPIAYREQVPARAAVPDIDRLEPSGTGPAGRAWRCHYSGRWRMKTALLRFKIARQGRRYSAVRRRCRSWKTWAFA